MKTKLLKKVRKRYSIIRYDYISDDNSVRHLRYFKEKFGLPLFEFVDNEVTFSMRSGVFETFEEVRDKLIDAIKADYRHTSKKRQIVKCKKVWYDVNS